LIAGPARSLGLDIEAERGQIQHIDESVDRTHRIVVIDAVRQCDLPLTRERMVAAINDAWLVPSV
jgi:hypothetical protein